jgi:uncharacterized protein YndB with AHSA1/START domain
MSERESESISVTRVLTGSPDRVFDAWIDPLFLQQWLAPTDRKTRRLRYIGLFLLLVAVFNLAIKFLGQ